MKECEKFVIVVINTIEKRNRNSNSLLSIRIFGMVNIVKTFEKTTFQFRENPAVHFKYNGGWQSRSYGQYYRDAEDIACSLLALDCEQGDVLNIMGPNCYPWLITAWGTIMTGAIPAGIYHTNSPEQACFIMEHSSSKIIFFDSVETYQKLYDELKNLTKIKHIVLWQGNISDDVRVLDWQQFVRLGQKAREERAIDKDLMVRINSFDAKKILTIIYTSGTTATPKAVQISHGNLDFVVQSIREQADLSSKERAVSYLPLSHIFEFALSVIGPTYVGSQIFICELDDLKETLLKARPTFFTAVPRVWEKFEESLKNRFTEARGLRKYLLHKLLENPEKDWARFQQKKSQRLWRKLLIPVVAGKIKQAMGLDQVRFALSGAAPIGYDTLLFFYALDIPICEGYGLSESSCVVSISMPNGLFKLGSVGKPLKGIDVRVAEDGEIEFKGPNVFCGYRGDREATAATISADGYFKTGDLGYLDEEGFLYINGRKKNMIITAGGKNIAAEKIDSLLMTIPEVEHAVAVGDQKPYLSALITLSPETALAKGRAIGSHAASTAELIRCPQFRKYMEGRIKNINHKLARVETIKKFHLLEQPFTVETKELTPTLKMRRQYIFDHYATEVDSMYHH